MDKEKNIGPPKETDKTIEPKLCINAVRKVFGDNTRAIQATLELGKQGLPRQEITDRTGCVLGLNDISFEVFPGEIFVIMGLSGSGKSTLIRCMNRLVDVTSGTITLDGDNIVNMSRHDVRSIRRSKISMVFQGFGLIPNRTVIENVVYPLKIRGIDRKARLRDAEDSLKLVGLEHWSHRYPRELSGGMQQRVGLARALANNPDVLLMDEPFSALDPLMRRQMQEELIKLERSLHKTIIFVTHDLDEAARVGDRIALLEEGNLIQIGTPLEIMLNPVNDYAASFVKQMDRGSVLTAGSVVDKTHAPLQSHWTPCSALETMQSHQSDFNFVVNARSRPIGFVTRHGLECAIRDGVRSLESASDISFKTVQCESRLLETYALLASGTPVAVVGSDEQFQGRLTPETVMAYLQHSDV